MQTSTKKVDDIRIGLIIGGSRVVKSFNHFSIVIPAHNEKKTIGKVIRESKKYFKDVIVVDDGSEDDTSKIAKEEGATVLRQVVNMGVGFTTITGNEYAIKNGSDVIVNIDSDGQHDVREIQKAIALLEKDELDIVIGSRFIEKTERFPWILKFGNRFLTLMNRIMFGTNISDTQSGFRVMTRDGWKKLDLRSSGYSICSEISAKIGMKKLRYGEVAVSTKFLDKFKGTTVLDGIQIFSNMLGWRIRKWLY